MNRTCSLAEIPPMPTFAEMLAQMNQPHEEPKEHRYPKGRISQKPGYRKCHTCRVRFPKSELRQMGKSLDYCFCPACATEREIEKGIEMSAENKYPEKKLTEEEYVAGVKSGDFLHVFDMNTNRVMVIQRDGYYPPEQLNKLVNLEENKK